MSYQRLSGTYRCGCGCGQIVKGIYCDPAREERQRAANEAREAARARMSDPEFQAKLQAARAEARKPATEA